METLSQHLPPERSFRDWLLVILAMVLLGVGIFQTYLYFSGQEDEDSAIVLKNQNDNSRKVELSPIQQIAQESAGDPNKFLSMIEEKASESKKEYDKGLSLISQKKWETILKERNKLSDDYVENNIEILNSSSEDLPDGSTIFRINYEINLSWAKVPREDSFFLIISKEKVSSFGLPEEKTNVFLTEKEISDYFSKEGFGTISKISPEESLVYASPEEASKSLSEILKASPAETKTILGNDKIIREKGGNEGHFFLSGKSESSGKCQVGFVDLFDKNVKLVSECQN